MTQEIILYTKSYCSYCKGAKALLRQKGVTFKEFEISDNLEPVSYTHLTLPTICSV